MDTAKQNANVTENDPTIEDDSKTNAPKLWKWNMRDFNNQVYQDYATNKSDGMIEYGLEVVYMDDLKKREEAFGICGECNEPGTGFYWCRACNAKRSQENFKNWTSGNKVIDEFIQQSQLNAVFRSKIIEWIPYENLENITYIAKGGFGKIYSAKWIDGPINCWDIENKKWLRYDNQEVALKVLNDSSDISKDFLNEIKSHINIYLNHVIFCFGISQDPDTKNYMMVLFYCEQGDLRSHLNKSEEYIKYALKVQSLETIATSLLGIHNAGKVHKDFHSGNILFLNECNPFISDLGMCRPAGTSKEQSGGIFGVLPYAAPEVLRGFQYTKEADIYSFGIIMNEYISEETPYSDIPHDGMLAVNICKGLRPKIPKYTPKLIADLIIRCWDAEVKNRPTAKELSQTFKKWIDMDGKIYCQMEEWDKIREDRLKNGSNENGQPKHSEAVYTSRLLNFQNLPEPVNSTDLSSYAIKSITESTSEVSDFSDCRLDELNLDIDEDEDDQTEE